MTASPPGPTGGERIEPAAGDRIELAAGTSRATIDASFGGRLARLDLGAGPVLRGPDGEPGWAMWGSYPLVPWSNRIPGGALRFGGTTWGVPVNFPDGSAIHGLGAERAWSVQEASSTVARLALALDTPPWTAVASQRFELGPRRLDLELAVTNTGDRPVPAGLGIHPWFRAGAVRVPAELSWPGEPLPVGEPVEVGPDDDLRAARVPPLMDRCYTGLTGSSVDVPGVRLSWDGPVTQVVVYTGEPGWVAVEPVTMANDGFGLAERGVAGHGVVTLAPGDRLEVRYTFETA